MKHGAMFECYLSADRARKILAEHLLAKINSGAALSDSDKKACDGAISLLEMVHRELSDTERVELKSADRERYLKCMKLYRSTDEAPTL